MKQKLSTNNGQQDESRELFPLGNLFATPGAVREIPPDQAWSSLQRHLKGDWGEVDSHDWHENDRAIERGTRLLSASYTDAGKKFWIITESDRSATTILLPEEY